MFGSNERYIARIMFQNKVYSLNGQSYEDMFCHIMQKANPNFEIVRAHGKSGDKKNDGFDKTTGTYYQVFAPEDIQKLGTIREASNKLRTDFVGLYSYWNTKCPVKQYFFVVNDKYRGMPPEIHAEMLELGKEYPGIEFGLFAAKDLEDVFIKLDSDSVVQIVGCMANPADQLDYSALSNVIEHLMNSPVAEIEDDLTDVPDFEEKIIFNGLSDKISLQLRSASYQVGGLEKYFNRNSEYTRQDIKTKFVLAYKNIKSEIDVMTPNYSDLVFVRIIDAIYPNGSVAIRNAILVLMAYYFESCDIFERPQMREG